jgi:hypothetical protein
MNKLLIAFIALVLISTSAFKLKTKLEDEHTVEEEFYEICNK